MQCPSCGSDHCQRLEVVYDDGTQNIRTTSHTAGAGLAGGMYGAGGATTTTTGKSQSRLAGKAAPPPKRRYAAALLGGGMGLIGLFNASQGWWLVSLVMVGVCAYFLYRAFRFNTGQWPALYRHWLDQWICHRCGHIYHQPAAPSPLGRAA